MRSVLTEFVHLLFSLPAYLCLLLAMLTLVSFRSRPAQRRRWAWLVALVLAYGVSIPATSNTLVAWVEQQHPVPNAAQLKSAARGDGGRLILVLSGGWFRVLDDGHYEVMLATQDWQRIRAAVGLWRQAGGSLVFTGAPVPDGSDSVAQRMALAAQQMGVPASDIRVETRSRNTYENLQFSQQQFGLHDNSPLVLVTSALHMMRSVEVAQRLGIAVLPYPCDFRADQHTGWRHWLPSNDAASALEEVLHELVGILAYKLRGQI